MNISQYDIELFLNTFMYSRQSIPEFITKYGKYDTMIELFKKSYEYLIKIRSYKSNKFIKNLLLGELGYESNKQTALYELPTLELISVIVTIIDMLNISNIEEIYSGIGLMSELLRLFYIKYEKLLKYGRPNLKSSDGKYWMETSGNTFCGIIKKDFFDILSNENDKNECYIASWPSKECYDYFKDFIQLKSPKLFILIGEHNLFDYSDTYENYYKLDIPLKQICYSDNMSHIGKSSHSYMRCYIKETEVNLTNENILEKTLELFKTHLNIDNLIIDDFVVNYDTIKNELINNDKMPKIISTLDNSKMQNMIDIIVKNKLTNYKLPLFLNSLEEIYFWLSMLKLNIHPNVNTRDKFLEFYKLYSYTTTMDGILILIENHHIPAWAISKRLARLCIALDYSIDINDKAWKVSINEAEKRWRTLLT